MNHRVALRISERNRSKPADCPFRLNQAVDVKDIGPAHIIDLSRWKLGLVGIKIDADGEADYYDWRAISPITEVRP